MTRILIHLIITLAISKAVASLPAAIIDSNVRLNIVHSDHPKYASSDKFLDYITYAVSCATSWNEEIWPRNCKTAEKQKHNPTPSYFQVLHSSLLKRQTNSCGNNSSCGTNNINGGSDNTIGGSSSASSSNGLSLADKIGIGISIGIGLPSTIVALYKIWEWFNPKKDHNSTADSRGGQPQTAVLGGPNLSSGRYELGGGH